MYDIIFLPLTGVLKSVKLILSTQAKPRLLIKKLSVHYKIGECPEFTSGGRRFLRGHLFFTADQGGSRFFHPLRGGTRVFFALHMTNIFPKRTKNIFFV